MIRAARPEDLPAIGRLIRGLAEYEKLSDAVEFDESELGRHLFGAPRYAEVLIAEDEGQSVGFAVFFHNYSTFLGKPGIYLEDIFVEPTKRGRGHGKALLESVARIAVERGCGRVEWSVLDWNAPSIGFYESLGANPLKDWTTFRLTGPALARLGAATEG